MIHTKYAKAERAGMSTTFSRIAMRRDTVKNWLDGADLPLEGEICITIADANDPDDAQYAGQHGQFKIGDGLNDWEDLEYYGGGAQVIVQDDDPDLTANVTVPVGTLWFNTSDKYGICYIKIQSKTSGKYSWQKLAPDNVVHMAPTGSGPTNPDIGDLWYQTDEGDLKICDESGQWVPSYAPVSPEGDVNTKVSKTGDQMTGALSISAVDVTDESKAILKVNTGNGSSIPGGGLAIRQDGVLTVFGRSKQITQEQQLTTKAYVDKAVDDSGGAYVQLETDINTSQALSNSLFFNAHPDLDPHPIDTLRDINFDVEDLEDEEPEVGTYGGTSDNYGKKVRVSNFRVNAPTLSIGNVGSEFRDGTPLPSGSIWQEGYKFYMNYSAQSNKVPKIEAKLMQRITFNENYGIDCRANHPNPDYAGKDASNTDGFENNTIKLRQVYWSKSNISGYQFEDGHPIQKVGWLASPDSSVYDDNANDIWGPPELRPATKGYVDEKVGQNILVKGSDLCADSEAGTQPGGFWRDAETGTIYMKVI